MIRPELTGRVERVQDLSVSPRKVPEPTDWTDTAKTTEAQDWAALGKVLVLDYFLLACICTHTFTCIHIYTIILFHSGTSSWLRATFPKKRMSVASSRSHPSLLLTPELLRLSQRVSGSPSLGWESQVLFPKAAWHYFSQGLEVLETKSHDRLFEIPYNTQRTIYLKK